MASDHPGSLLQLARPRPGPELSCAQVSFTQWPPACHPPSRGESSPEARTLVSLSFPSHPKLVTPRCAPCSCPALRNPVETLLPRATAEAPRAVKTRGGRRQKGASWGWEVVGRGQGPLPRHPPFPVAGRGAWVSSCLVSGLLWEHRSLPELGGRVLSQAWGSGPRSWTAPPRPRPASRGAQASRPPPGPRPPSAGGHSLVDSGGACGRTDGPRSSLDARPQEAPPARPPARPPRPTPAPPPALRRIPEPAPGGGTPTPGFSARARPQAPTRSPAAPPAAACGSPARDRQRLGPWAIDLDVWPPN